MKIYINENYEIKAINSTNDDSLTEIEIDKNLAFGNMSDFMILNYCYKQDENGYSIYPASDYSKLVEEDYKIPKGIPYVEVEIPTGKYAVSVNAENKEVVYKEIEKSEIEVIQDKISILEAENETLKQELSITQDAVNELIFNSLNM